MDEEKSRESASVEEIPEVVRDEQKVLDRVLESIRTRARKGGGERRDYDAELVALRDQIAEARLEDAPPLIAQMERLQAVAARRAEVAVGLLDARTPYFAHLRLKENGKLRDVCIGRGTYLDPEHGVRVVDWRNAPVSRVYYRYQEGDSYEESFGDRDIEGEVLVRRDVTIANATLLRIGASDATFVRTRDGRWKVLATRAARLAGGQGTAVVPTETFTRGALGSGHGEEGIGRRDRFLPEIAALLDPRQFEAISKPAAGVFVVQGGAGSGKTTIGLHRIAYLAFQAPRRFTPDKVLVVVPSRALATYTSRVLPSLDVPNVGVATLVEWQRDARVRAFSNLPARTTDEAPLAAVKLKRHPHLLALLEKRIDEETAEVDRDLRAACKGAGEIGRAIASAWDALSSSPLAGRLAGLRRWISGVIEIPGIKPPPSSTVRLPIDHLVQRAWRRARDVVWWWAELLTDRQAILGLAADDVPGLAPLSRADLEEALRWCARRCEVIASHLGQPDDDRRARRDRRDEASAHAADDARDEGGGQQSLFPDEAIDGEAIERPKKRHRSTSDEDESRPAYRDDDGDDDMEHRKHEGVDGRPVDEEEALGPALDPEDDALLLRLHQRLKGPLHGKGKAPLKYEHVFVDEVQDCAAVDLAVLVECTAVHGGERSMTLAGDVAQRLTLDTGLGEFAPALEKLGLPHVEVEPLTIGYRSTRQVLELAREVLGPLAPKVPPTATRDGAPIERHVFPDAGAAAAFLAGALRDLSVREPVASIAIITRHPYQADVYFDVLSRAEIPNLRRVSDQDFPFKAGVDVTDVKQVKGLEWDYVILVDVNASSYGDEPEARHLLHIAATRAAHQLWLVASGEPSPLVGGWDA